MRKVTFTLPDAITTPVDIAKTIKAACDDPSFGRCMDDLDAQMRHLRAGPVPRGGEVGVSGGCDAHGCHVDGHVTVHF